MSVALIAVAALAHAYLIVDFSLPPAEDAAMLMRYAQHVANGHGVVWNIGDPPVDGATDFLFMIAVAALTYAGIALETATRGLITVAHVVTACIVYVTVRKVHRAPWSAALASSIYLVAGPATAYISTYFGAPVFADCAAGAWACALIIMNGSTSRAWSIAFAILSLLTGLVRPEGVLLAALMLISIVVAIGVKRSAPVMISFFAIFGALGLAYFLSRWQYFGHPLPNPFYKKGGGALHPAGIKDSVFNTVKFTLPLLPLFAIGLFSRNTRRATLAASIPILGFAACFILVSNEMNFAGRFQYALLPMALMAWPIPMRAVLCETERIDVNRSRLTTAAIAVFLIGALTYFQVVRDDWTHHADGRAPMGKLLHAYKNKNYRLATSEAGLLPLYSEWKTLDTWGLNDYTIATSGTVTFEYLETFDPDLIVFHAYDPPHYSGPTGLPGWSDMVHVLRQYVATKNFTLIAAYGQTPDDLHYYYAHPRANEPELFSAMRKVEYAWPETGRPATNHINEFQEIRERVPRAAAKWDLANE